MPKQKTQHPVEVLTIRLTQDLPRLDFQNDDVAFIPVTRFNLRMAAGPDTKSTHLKGRNLVESPEYEAFWKSRIEIFERVCIPSVLNLSPGPDAWFIAFGEVDPPFLQEFLERLALYPWIRPYLRRQDDPRSDKPLDQLLADHMQSLGKPYLCTTRLDSDDSLQQQFLGALDMTISQLRDRGLGHEKRSLNFPYGVVEAAGALSVHMRGTSMFQSYYAPLDAAEGPYPIPHDRVRERMPLVEVLTNLPMWIYHRHEDVIDTPSAIPRDRLPVADPEQVYPLFGLTPDSAAARQAGPDARKMSRTMAASGRSRDLARQAAQLRESAYWRKDQRAAASNLAKSMHQPETAYWLSAGASGAVDATAIMREVEGTSRPVLNAAMLARLGELLQDAGQALTALRAYEYAVQLSPADRHLRVARDKLAGSLACEFDLDEQMELSSIERPGDGPTNTVVIVVSRSELSAEGFEPDPLHERARNLAKDGFAAHIVTLLDSERGNGEAHPQATLRDGVAQEYLIAASDPHGEDASRRAFTRQLAKHVARLQPCLLMTDGSLIAQTITAAIGRAFGIPVDFGSE